MISRVAEACFWMHRYVERVENTARLLGVNAAHLLDVHLPVFDRWRPIVIAAGEDRRFVDVVGDALEDGEAVQEYFVWDERCPVSIVSSLRQARELARTIRHTLSSEAWGAMNEAWLWLRGGQGRRLYGRERLGFYERIKERCHLFHGVCHDTILHQQPFDFMRLGMLLERAGQTARMVDIKYHNLGPTRVGRESPYEAAQWLAILRSCSASESFFKSSLGPPTGPAVAQFLFLEPTFPRAVLHCHLRAWNFLQRIRSWDGGEVGHRSAALLGEALRRLRTTTLDEVLQRGIHAESTWIVDSTADICDAVYRDYFAVTEVRLASPSVES